MTTPPAFSYSVTGAAAALGISPRKLEDLITEEKLFVRWIDGKRVIPAPDLAKYVDSLPLDKPEPKKRPAKKPQ